MPVKGRSHFDTYTDQNRVKHAILTKYLGAYLRALSRAVDAFHYIDGFAGPGTYESEHAGSPLVAIELLAAQQRAATASFVENDPVSFARLEETVRHAPGVERLVELPWLRCAEFSECVDEVLNRAVFRRYRRTATFAFVDPCGLKGLYLADIAKILSLPFGECLVFLNYDGLNRWVGGVRAATHARDRLDRFFGGAAAADAALACLSTADPKRESCLLDTYLRAINGTTRARFVLPFRFRASTRDRTSHYLIHLSRHPLAFTIMKEVMKAESAPNEDLGSFGFIPPDELVDQGQLFTPNADRAREQILEELRNGPRPVSHFTKEWPRKPGDMFVEREYRRQLLTLEQDRSIEVVDPTRQVVAPAGSRRRMRGAATLADRYLVRLRTGS